MVDKEMIEAMRMIMKEELEPINQRLEKIESDVVTMKDDIAEIKEDAAITRGAVNTLLEWADKAQVQVKIPLFKKAE